MVLVMQELPLVCLMLLLFCRDPGVGAQEFWLHQPQDKVSVAAGETLTLNCTTSGMAIAGATRWLKGWGSENKTIYDQRGSLPRVMRAVNGSDTDFTIHIRNVQPEDTGTYYCVKFVKRGIGQDELFQHGNGTEVSVQAKPSSPLVSGPEQRVSLGQSVSFNCTTGGFFPKEILVKWFKNRDPMMAQQPQITEWGVKTYNVSSTVMVTLQKDDVPSQLTCEVQHSTLPAPLRGSFQLSRVLRVPPSVEVRSEPSPAELNKIVTFTCLVKEFYPAHVSVSWLENGIEINAQNISQPRELRNGLFELRSQVEVQATEEKNGSTIICRVVHDAQAPASSSASLLISNPAQGESSKESQMPKGENFLSSFFLLLWLGMLLEKALLGGLLFFLFKHMKSKALDMLPYPTPPQSLAARARSQGLATASSDV
ncbi:signal-regulatory protein beta-1-like [Acridotheres tristis]